MQQGCTHLKDIKSPEPRTPEGCEECMKTRSRWVALRLCQTCGHVGCCDSSPNRHAAKHFHATERPLIISLEPGQGWGYCCPDEKIYQTAG
jgi:uncharacterized UBP type Zn finger protein